MDFIWNRITDWLKEILVGGIMGNLQGLFDQVNTQVAGIAGQVGTTPQAWNGGVYSMIRSLSDQVILPIAGVILAIVMTMELLQLVMEKNNMHDFELGEVVANLEARLMEMEIGPLLGLWFQSLFVGVTMNALTICIFVVIYGRMVEIYTVTSLAPLPMATMMNREWGQMGQNYLRSLFALGFQALWRSTRCWCVPSPRTGMWHPPSGPALATRCSCASRFSSPAASPRESSGRISPLLQISS